MKSSQFLLLSGIFASLGMLVSCADNDLAYGGGKSDGDKGTAVTFNVSYAQDDAQNAMVTPAAGNTRAFAGAVTRVGFANGLAMLGLTPEDLTSQKLPVSGADNLCLIETTTAGVNPPPVQVAGAPQTRADITTIEKMPNFYTTGFCGTSKVNPTIPWLYNGDTTTPWFYNKETNPSGTLVTPIKWSWDKPYGIFFAVAVGAKKKSNVKLTFSPKRAAIPYVDFTVKPNVVDQEDLMTACSGEIHYEKRFVAPTVNLKFRHALTAVRFKVGQNLSYDKTITKVEIINAMSKGCYNLPRTVNDRGAWGPLSGKTTFTLDGLNVSTDKGFDNVIIGKNDNYTFYMIPQKLEGVSVKITFSDKSTISANLSGEWRAGTTKTYALSENASTWDYVLSVSPLVDATSTATKVNYTVQSYRMCGFTKQQPVPWKVVSYEESKDNGLTWEKETTSKPEWLTALSMDHGEGNTMRNETGIASLKPATIDRLAEYNKVLQEAPERGTKDNPYDLSMYNFRGEKYINGRNTANCYLISAPGWYKIPLVYGNGVVNGIENESAYKSQRNSTEQYLAWFTDHDGSNSLIYSPYINCQSSTNYATQAAIVWADQNNLVENLEVVTSGGYDKNAYLKFYVDPLNIKNGNAVICVKNAKNVTMWSWHLWFAQKDALRTVRCINYAGTPYDFAKQPLGFAYRKWESSDSDKPRAVRITIKQTWGQGNDRQKGTIVIRQEPGRSVKEFSSTLYQFGNKNAYPSISFNKNATGEHIADGELKTFDGKDMSIENSIKYPEIFYTDGSGWDKNYGYYNLWSMDNTSGDPNYIDITKTIFDPCPVGFSVPALNRFRGFTLTESGYWLMKLSGDWDKGWHFTRNDDPRATLYFPDLPYRDKNGKLNTSNNIIYYWTSNPFNNKSGYKQQIGNTLISCGSDDRMLGLPILPVSE